MLSTFELTLDVHWLVSWDRRRSTYDHNVDTDDVNDDDHIEGDDDNSNNHSDNINDGKGAEGTIGKWVGVVLAPVVVLELSQSIRF
jgi:hypothetical protein